MARWVRWAVAAIFALAACNGTSSTAVRRSDLDRNVERDVFDLLLAAGATDREAACLAEMITKGIDEISDVFTVDNLGDEPSQPFGPQAGECALHDRLNEIGRGVRLEAEREGEEVHDRFVQQFADELLAVGATAEEAECIAEAWFDTSIDPDDEQARREQLDQCASHERVGQLLDQRYFAPLLMAGATEEEARCLDEAIAGVDLYYPSEDFMGPLAAETTVDAFVGRAPNCGTPERLRELAHALHSQS